MSREVGFESLKTGPISTLCLSVPFSPLILLRFMFVVLDVGLSFMLQLPCLSAVMPSHHDGDGL